jgi:hypothetical protein
VIPLQRSSYPDAEHFAMEICDLLDVVGFKLSNAVQGSPRLSQVSFG